MKKKKTLSIIIIKLRGIIIFNKVLVTSIKNSMIIFSILINSILVLVCLVLVRLVLVRLVLVRLVLVQVLFFIWFGEVPKPVLRLQCRLKDTAEIAT